jgi:hypothetical protein
MDEIQNEPNEDLSGAATDETDDVVETDDNVEAENASAEENKVTFDERQQEVMNKAIGEKVAKTHEERRLREEAEAKYQRLLDNQPKPKEPTIPELPDVDDFYGDPNGYNARILAREEAIREHAVFNAQNRLVRDQQEQKAREAEYEQQVKQREAVESYTKKAADFGLTNEQLNKDASLVTQAGIHPELSVHLLNDPQGPLVTNYLANNVLELDRVRNLSPIDAAVYIATVVRPLLKGVKQSTKAPAPASIDNGGGVPEKQPQSIKGATFV